MNRILLSLCALLLASSLCAHDYWLQPESFTPAVNKPVVVHLHLGDHLASEGKKPHLAKVTQRFELRSGKTVVDLSKKVKNAALPLVSITCPKAGSHVLVLDRGSHLITLKADKFEAYLKEEGLEGIIAHRKKLGESKQDGRERYSRFLKTILRAGDKSDDTATTPVGQKLEIIPAKDPSGLKKGDSLTVRILFDGKALAGVKVFALTRVGDKTMSQEATTDKIGAATFKIDRAGMWLVRLVHMRRTMNDKEADWESFWGAMTFQTR